MDMDYEFLPIEHFKLLHDVATIPNVASLVKISTTEVNNSIQFISALLYCRKLKMGSSSIDVIC